MKYWVSTYELYPIYEPAEGGYYYDGVEYMGSLKPCKSLKKARRLLRKAITELQEIYGEEKVYEYGWSGHLWGARTKSKYIGEGTIVRIETRRAGGERGYTPYC